jgi:hypothetical protein
MVAGSRPAASRRMSMNRAMQSNSLPNEERQSLLRDFFILPLVKLYGKQ